MSAGRGVAGRWAPHLLMLASGFAGLGYQIVWTRACSLWLGHESAAVLAVVAAFFGGLSLGGLLLGPRVEASERPDRWYAGCELVVALWSALLVVRGGQVMGALERVTGAAPSPAWQWSVAFIGAFFVFLPATAAMGATLPAVERWAAGAGRGTNRSVSALYASNTAGGVLGVLGIALWLIPSVGLARSAAACIAANVVCALLALLVFSRDRGAAANAAPAAAAPGVAARLALTGLLGIAYEVLVVRVLSQVTEDTVYTFAILLAVYLVGTALGAAAYARWLEGRVSPERLADVLFAALATACLVGTGTLFAAESVRDAVLSALGRSLAGALAAEATLALFAFALPTAVMGAQFSHLGRAALAAKMSFGRALGLNTLGAATAPALAGVLAVPALGAKGSLVLVCLGYLALASPRAWSQKVILLPAAAAAAVALFAPSLSFIDVPEGGHVVRYDEGVLGAVSVTEDASGVRRLRINNRQQEGSSATLRVDARQAWLPLLLHRAPRRALFLGLGTGVTATSAAQDPALEIDAIELLPEVIAASPLFTERAGLGAAPPRVHLLAGDARRFVRTTERRYDVIVSDNFHPARSGSGALYTVEHFRAVLERLEPGGLFCQWLPLHQLDVETLRSIVRSFVAAYPNSWGLLASNSLETPVLGLVGRVEAGGFDRSAVDHRLARPSLSGWAMSLGLEEPYAVFGAFIAGHEALVRFAGTTPLNTDDHPVVAYRAPRITYAPESTPRDRLMTVLQHLSIQPRELFSQVDPSWGQHLIAYWQARSRFLEVGRDVRPSPRVQEMLAQVREPLLSVLRISPDFRPAYDPLLTMGKALAASDPEGARALLAELARIQPERPEADSALATLELLAAPRPASTR